MSNFSQWRIFYFPIYGLNCQTKRMKIIKKNGKKQETKGLQFYSKLGILFPYQKDLKVKKEIELFTHQNTSFRCRIWFDNLKDKA